MAGYRRATSGGVVTIALILVFIAWAGAVVVLIAVGARDPWVELPSEVDPYPLSSSREQDHPTLRPFDQERDA